MTHLLATAEVEDLDEWKATFNDNESYRTEHGQRGYQAFQSVDDPDEIVVLFEWDERKDARAFFESEEMREKMVEAGIKGKPDMTSLERVDQKP